MPLVHLTTPPDDDGSKAINKAQWVEPHVFNDGDDDALLIRDSAAAATGGYAWVPAVGGGLLMVPAAGGPPEYLTAPTAGQVLGEAGGAPAWGYSSVLTKYVDVTLLRAATLFSDPLVGVVAGVAGYWPRVLGWHVEENTIAPNPQYAAGAPQLGLRWTGFTNLLITQITPANSFSAGHYLQYANANQASWTGGTAATRSLSGVGIDLFATADMNTSGPPTGTYRVAITYTYVPSLN